MITGEKVFIYVSDGIDKIKMLGLSGNGPYEILCKEQQFIIFYCYNLFKRKTADKAAFYSWGGDERRRPHDLASVMDLKGRIRKEFLYCFMEFWNIISTTTVILTFFLDYVAVMGLHGSF